MKKQITLFASVIFFTSFINAQSWSPVGSGANGSVRALSVYNAALYAGGSFDSSGTGRANNIVSWNSSLLDTLLGGIDTTPLFPASVYCETVYNSSLFAGGQFLHINNLISSRGIAQWNGLVWDSLHNGLQGSVYALAVYNGNLYLGGQFSSFTPYGIFTIAQWNGTKFDSASTISDITSPYGIIYAMAVYNGDLYAAGSFQFAGYKKAYNIARWDGSNWDSVGRGINTQGIVYALAVYNGSLYAGGYFDSAGGILVQNMAQWNGSIWSPVGSGINDSVFALNVDGSILTAGGAFTAAGGKQANHIAYWDGAIWDSIGAGTNGTVYTLCNYSNELYAGGHFSTSGNTNVRNMARWTSPLGIDNLGSKNADITVYPNPSNGTFNVVVNSKLSMVNKMQIGVYNVMGERISQFTINRLQFNIDLSSQPNGIYFYKVINEDGELMCKGKLIMER
jgi:trimeric autotransporter adhesin